MPKHRTQLLLDEAQYERLAELARSQKRSVSAVVREFVDRGLEEKEETKSRKLRALERLAEIGQRIEERGGVPSEDLIAQLREERERQRDEVVFGGSDP